MIISLIVLYFQQHLVLFWRGSPFFLKRKTSVLHSFIPTEGNWDFKTTGYVVEIPQKKWGEEKIFLTEPGALWKPTCSGSS